VPGVIDTNILLYAANRDAEEHADARGFVTEAAQSRDTWYLTDGILYEFMRVATHPRVFATPLSWKEALGFLNPFLASEQFDVVSTGQDHWQQLPEVLEPLTHPAGNLFFDVRTVTLMREHGIRRIYTTDTDFLQFAEIEVVNPLRREEKTKPG